MNNFNWESFKNGDLAVKFNSKDDYVTFLKECSKRNIRWSDGTTACKHTELWENKLNSDDYENFGVRYNLYLYGLVCQDIYSKNFEYYNSNEYSVKIVVKNNKTIATLNSNGIETVGIAKCNPVDNFNFEIGAKLALERCFEKSKGEKEFKHKFEIGDKIKIVDTERRFHSYRDFVKAFTPQLLNRFNEQISVSKDKTYTIVEYGKHLDLEFASVYPNPLYIIQDENDNIFVFYENGLEKVKELKIYSNNIMKGVIGKKISQTALFGEELFVGDIVELYDTDRGVNCGECIVCQYEAYPDGFILGVGGAVFKDGISDDWQIRKVKSYTELRKGTLLLSGYRHLEIRD